jgi:hypothetical protein
MVIQERPSEISIRLNVENQAKYSFRITRNGTWQCRTTWETEEDEFAVRDDIRGIRHPCPIRPEFLTSEFVPQSGIQFQRLRPTESDSIQFPLERCTSRDPCRTKPNPGSSG